jgi:tetratricopeptide (TPR) repeat protein
VARAKKAKTRRESESIAHTLDELESRGDRLTSWILENPRIVLGTGLVILVAGGAFGILRSQQEGSLEAATAALGAAQLEYRKAMGAPTDGVDVPEPANPETAKRVREEYAARFGEIAREHPGTAGGALAAMEAGTLLEQLGSVEDALATWSESVASLASDQTIRALIELRIAGAYEAQARWIEAGEAFERAADVTGYPLRQSARADAARCYAEGGEVERALAAFARVKSEDPDVFIPEHLNARLLELAAGQRLN